MNFASDNTAPVAPNVMDAMVAANQGTCPSYGVDSESEHARVLFCDLFETDCSVYFLASGTATNSVGLAAVTPPHGAMLCSDVAHIHLDECGAPEFFTGGAKLQTLTSSAGKLSPDVLLTHFDERPMLGPHRSPYKVLSLTQGTEAGTVYSVSELEALSAIARNHDLVVQMDGARFANAVAALGVSPAELSWRAGIDMLSFGGTKNGCLAAEALVVFNKSLVDDVEFFRKRAGHLWSKGRYLGAQFKGYLTDGYWLTLAAHANAMAHRLSSGLQALPGIQLIYPTEINEVFVTMPDDLVTALQNAGASFYPWVCPGLPASAKAYRLITSWSTDDAEIDQFLTLAQRHYIG